MALETTLSTTQRLRQLPRQWQSGLTLYRGLGALSLLVALWGGYLFSGRPVTLVINGQPRQIRTHRPTVELAIQELDLTLETEDIVDPPPNATLSSGDTIAIQLARPVTIKADGQTRHMLTHRQNIADILAEIVLTANPRDEVLIDGKQVTLQSTLPTSLPASANQTINPLFAAATPRGAIASSRPETVQITINRAVLVTLHDDQTTNTFYTARPTIADALQEHGVTLFAEDKVTPDLETQPSPELEIRIERSIPIVVKVNGRVIKTRTLKKTVGDTLAYEGIALMGQDFSRPPANHALLPNDIIEIVRVRETVEIEQEFIPFETQWLPDEELQLDQREVRQTGENGIIKTRTRIRYENGQEAWRKLEDEWVDQEQKNRQVAYGTKIIIRTLNTQDGPIEYWRKISMLATAYSAATSGKAPDHPEYGITRTGLQAGYGIVAVDPRVIPLMTNLYIPNYGPALAGDTGGGVLGKHVDLGYDDDGSVPLMYEWRDVYILTPVPPADKIRYVLPQWPQQR